MLRGLGLEGNYFLFIIWLITTAFLIGVYLQVIGIIYFSVNFYVKSRKRKLQK